MTEAWKIVENLCRCCHSEGSSFTSLSVSCSDWDGGLVYSDIIKICFDIDLHHVEGPLGPFTNTICKHCIKKLKDATLFKKQVFQCEERFMNVYKRNNIVAGSEPLEVKKEVVTPAEEYLGVKKEEVSSTEECRENAEESDENWFSSDDEFIKQSRDENSDEDVKPIIQQSKVERETQEDVCKNEKNKSIFHLKSSDFKIVDDVFICQHCKKKYNQKKSLRYHIRAKHYSMPVYICGICNKGLMTSTSLIVHKLEKHKIDHRIKCNACNSLFNSRLQLKNHKNSFHMLGGKVYKCDQCEYESFSSYSLYRHKSKHKSVKEFVCRFCKKAFLRRQTLVLHERIHTGDRRKVCKVCGQAFVQKASLNYHMTKYHPGVDIETIQSADAI